MGRFFVAIDIGAGSGTKLGLFDPNLQLVNFEHYVIDQETTTYALFCIQLRHAIGIAGAGLLRSDGKIILANNFVFLNNNNLRDCFWTNFRCGQEHGLVQDTAIVLAGRPALAFPYYGALMLELLKADGMKAPKHFETEPSTICLEIVL